VAGTRAKRLRAIGNAIVLPQAAEFARSAVEALLEWSEHPETVSANDPGGSRWYEEQLILPGTTVAVDSLDDREASAAEVA
jgi:hypothetical protein